MYLSFIIQIIVIRKPILVFGLFLARPGEILF